MSTLHHESILETIYEDLVVEFRTDLFNWTQDEIDTEVYKRTMSVLHHEDILEDCYCEILEEFRTDLLFMSQEQIDAMVYQRFEDKCQ